MVSDSLGVGRRALSCSNTNSSCTEHSILELQFWRKDPFSLLVVLALDMNWSVETVSDGERFNNEVLLIESNTAWI